MFEEIAPVVPSVTKTKRKESPGFSPAGVVSTTPASAPPPQPSPNQSKAATVAHRAWCARIAGLLDVDRHVPGAQHRTPTPGLPCGGRFLPARAILGRPNARVKSILFLLMRALTPASGGVDQSPGLGQE